MVGTSTSAEPVIFSAEVRGGEGMWSSWNRDRWKGHDGRSMGFVVPVYSFKSPSWTWSVCMDQIRFAPQEQIWYRWHRFQLTHCGCWGLSWGKDTNIRLLSGDLQQPKFPYRMPCNLWHLIATQGFRHNWAVRCIKDHSESAFIILVNIKGLDYKSHISRFLQIYCFDVLGSIFFRVTTVAFDSHDQLQWKKCKKLLSLQEIISLLHFLNEKAMEMYWYAHT